MYNTCVIKNIDNKTHIVLGVEMSPNDEYSIPDNKRVMASENDFLIESISSGLIQVGNGSEYITTTAAQINYLRSGISDVKITATDIDLEVKNNVKGFKLSRSNSDVSLTTSFSDVLSVNGSGIFLGMKLIFSNDEVNVRLEVDGVEIFDVPVGELRDMNYESNTNVGINRFFGGSRFGEFEFFPKDRIGYTTSLKIQVKKTVNWNIDKEFHHIFYSEDS